LLGDDGSGYAIGRAVLRAAMRAFDGRGPATALVTAVGERFALTSLAGLKIVVRGLPIDQIAAVAPLALAAATDGDAVAAEIVRDAGVQLAHSVAAVARALGWEATRFPFVTAGGLFESGPLIHAPVMDALGRLGTPADWRPARFAPDAGAALLAARAAGVNVEQMITRMAAIAAARPEVTR
jgi:N-acetylglucosamine kinase-like BadF-type ATPase